MGHRHVLDWMGGVKGGKAVCWGNFVVSIVQRNIHEDSFSFVVNWYWLYFIPVRSDLVRFPDPLVSLGTGLDLIRFRTCSGWCKKSAYFCATARILYLYCCTVISYQVSIKDKTNLIRERLGAAESKA